MDLSNIVARPTAGTGRLSRIKLYCIIWKSENICIYIVDGVKVDFVKYPYSLLKPVVEQDNLRLASVEDIAAMKVAAIIGRGTRKDFIDIYFLLKIFSLQEILDLYSSKYPDGTLFVAIKSLTYFEDAESDPVPEMLEAVNWSEVKKDIVSAVRNLLA